MATNHWMLIEKIERRRQRRQGIKKTLVVHTHTHTNIHAHVENKKDYKKNNTNNNNIKHRQKVEQVVHGSNVQSQR